MPVSLLVTPDHFRHSGSRGRPPHRLKRLSCQFAFGEPECVQTKQHDPDDDDESIRLFSPREMHRMALSRNSKVVAAATH
jgi:uncharacterized protein YgiB involved in biofilm formation